MKPSSELKETYELVEKYSEGIKTNVSNLYQTITDLENKIETDSLNSYNKISTSLDDLKAQVDTSLDKVNGIDEERYSKEADALIGYYSLLVSMKNDLCDFTLDNTNDCIFTFDEFINNSNVHFENFSDIFKMVINSHVGKEKEFIDSIINSICSYKDILIKYQSLYQNASEDIMSAVKSFNKDYLIAFERYIKKDKELREQTILSRNKFLDFSVLENKSSSLLPTKNAEKLYKEYLSKRKSLIRSFNKEYSLFIRKTEAILLSTISSSFAKEISKEDVLKTLGMSDDDFTSSLKKISSGLDYDEFERAVTDIFTSKFKNAYDELSSKEKSLETEYLLLTKNDEDRNSLTSMFRSTEDALLLLGNQMVNEDIFKEYIQKEKSIINDKCDNLFDFYVSLKRIESGLERCEIAYRFEMESISLSFKKELRSLVVMSENRLSKIHKQMEYGKERNISMVDELSEEDSLYTLELGYKLDKLKIDKKYTFKKAFIMETSKLLKKENEMDLIDPILSLEYILAEYNALIGGYKAVYDTQIEILDRSSERTKLQEMTNYSFMYAALRHRSLVADECLDMAKKEYDLKLKILDSIRVENSRYNSERIEDAMKQYLDDKERIERIKVGRISSLKSKLDNLENKKDKDGELENELKDILDDYDKSIKEINEILVNDPIVKFHQNESRIFNEKLVDYFDTSKIVLNDSLKSALAQMQKAYDGFDEILKSLDAPSIDYKTSYAAYKFNYMESKQRLDDFLYKESSPYLDKIQEINSRYDFDFYKNQYNEADNEYKKEMSDLDDWYNAEREKIELSLKPSEFTLEKLDTDIQTIIDESKSRIDVIETTYKSSKDEIYTDYTKELSENEDSLISSIKKASNEILKLKGVEDDILISMSKDNESSIKDLKKASLKIDKARAKDFLKSKKINQKKASKSIRKLSKKYKRETIKSLTK